MLCVVVFFQICGTKVVQIPPTSLTNQTGRLRLSVTRAQEVSQRCGLSYCFWFTYVTVCVCVIVSFCLCDGFSFIINFVPYLFFISFVVFL